MIVIRKVIILFFVFLVTLIISELLLRLSWHASRQVRWSLMAPWEKTEYVSDAELYFRGNPDHPEHDEHGFRNRDALDRADVVAIGDSQTYGVGITRYEAWPKQLGGISGKSVYNMGVSGWGPVQYRGQIDHALGLQPEAVVVALYIGNDIYDAYNLAYEMDTGASLRDEKTAKAIRDLEENQSLTELSIVAALVQGERSKEASPSESDEVARSHKNGFRSYLSRYSMLYALMRGLWYVSSGSGAKFTPWTTDPRDDYWVQLTNLVNKYPKDMIAYEAGNVRTVLTPAYRLQGINFDDPRIAEGVEVALRALDEMYMYCQLQGVDFMVVILPTKEYTFYPFMASNTYNSVAMEKIHRIAHFENEMRDRIFKILDKRKIEYVDMLPVFQNVIKEDRENPFFESLNGHFNASGNKLIAQSINRYFQEKYQEM